MYYGKKAKEVIDYVKDLRTGKIIKQKKLKPVGLGSNTCIIEMFEGKKKVKEAVTHNIVNNILNQIAFLQFFYDNCKQSSNLTIFNPFTNIILTDYEGEENADEVCVRGNVIAWANKSTTYVGTSSLRGTINNAESELTDRTQSGYLKYVFDFPTHAANGNINSIWWAYGGSNSYKMLGDAYLSKASVQTYTDMCCDGSYVYAVRNSGTIYKMIMDSANAETISFTTNNLRGIEWDGTNFWLADNTTKTIYKCNTVFSIISTVALTVSENITGITLYNNKIFVSTTAALYRIALDGTVEARITAETLGFQSGGILGRAKANNKYLMCFGRNGSNYYYAFLDTNGNTMYLRDVTDDSNFRVQDFCFVNNEYYANSNFYIRHTSYRDFAYLGSVGAHTKLPSTITKTSTNTMKVTYIFSIEMPTGGSGT